MWYMTNVDNLSFDLKYKIYGNVQTLKDENIKTATVYSLKALMRKLRTIKY